MKHKVDVPLVVDLDGTLIKTDMLLESLMHAVGNRKISLLELVRSLINGKSAFKVRLSEEFDFDPTTLPYRSEVIGLIENSNRLGREVVLATAAAPKIANAIAGHLRLFTKVYSSESTLNLSGANKARVLVKEFGEMGFDYVGDSAKDFPVWQVARNRYLTGHDRRAKKLFNRLYERVEIIESSEMKATSSWARSLRIHQWVKNLLVFAPAIAAHEFFNLSLTVNLLLAFFSFSFLASAVYLINDVFDLQNDRAHPTKSLRPIPKGRISIISALLVATILLVIALGVGLALPSEFAVILFSYFILTSLYTVWIKKLLLLDVITLAGLYTLRVVAGGMAFGVPVSSWLLAFSFFIFLSLSFVKRSSELGIQVNSDSSRSNGRAYLVRDLPIINGLGLVSGLVSVLVFSLYLDSDTVTSLYATSGILWLAVPVLTFWVSYVWVRTGRGEVDEDPILFALKDRASLLSGFVFLGIFLVAQIGLS